MKDNLEKLENLKKLMQERDLLEAEYCVAIYKFNELRAAWKQQYKIARNNLDTKNKQRLTLQDIANKVDISTSSIVYYRKRGYKYIGPGQHQGKHNCLTTQEERVAKMRILGMKFHKIGDTLGISRQRTHALWNQYVAKRIKSLNEK